MKHRGRELWLQHARASAHLRAVGTGGIACAVAMGLPWYLYLRSPWRQERRLGVGGCCQGCQDVPQAPHGGVTGLTDLWFPRSCALPFLKIRVMSPFQGIEPPCWSLLQVAWLAACPFCFLGGWDRSQAEPKGILQRGVSGKGFGVAPSPWKDLGSAGLSDPSWLNQDMKRGMAGLGWAGQGTSRANASRDEASTVSLGNLLPCVTTLVVRTSSLLPI